MRVPSKYDGNLRLKRRLNVKNVVDNLALKWFSSNAWHRMILEQVTRAFYKVKYSRMKWLATKINRKSYNNSKSVYKSLS